MTRPKTDYAEEIAALEAAAGSTDPVHEASIRRGHADVLRAAQGDEDARQHGGHDWQEPGRIERALKVAAGCQRSAPVQLSNFEMLGASGRNDEQGHYAEVIAFPLPSAALAEQFAIFMMRAVTEALAKQDGTTFGETSLRPEDGPH